MRFVRELDGNRIRVRATNGKYCSRTVMEDGTFECLREKFAFNRETKEITLISSQKKDVTVKPVSPSVRVELPKVQKFDINERFEHLETFVDMTIERHTASVVICGDAGLGKSHTVLSRLADHDLIEGEDYTVHKGHTTPKGLYSMLYENRNGIIVIDDMDSVFKDSTSLNLLKAALDSYSKRIVTWNSMGFIDDGLPKMFEFSGQIIFITNKKMETLDEAVKSRSLCVDVSMTTEEKISRMKAVAKTMMPEINLNTKLEVIDFIEERVNSIKELNFRTMIKATKIYEATGNERAVEYMLYNS